MPKSKNDVTKTSEPEVKNSESTTKTTKTAKSKEPKVVKEEVVVEEVKKVSKTKKVKEEGSKEVVSTQPQPEPETKTKVKKTKSKPQQEEVTSVASSTTESSEVVEGETESVKKQRRVVNREELGKTLDSLVQMVDDEVPVQQESDSKLKSKTVRFLKSLSKQLRQVKTDFLKVSSKKEPKPKSERSANSGFLKPVKISSEMQRFAGLKEDQLVSRVDVTKAICKYVKDHNLQNPEDKRQFTPDEKLAKLLDTKDNLTYYNLQKSIQKHFVK